ncbi:MAG: flagellin [Treponema sp.]|jgi:flagellin|nr:flagellin [Treponema sp.]
MIINHNLSAQFANRNLSITQGEISKNIERLSSGQRINKAADDASGLAVSEKFRSQIRGLNQAERNIQNGVAFIQTTEGYLQETQDILHRIRELSVQSANGIYTDEDRIQIQVEVSQLVDEVNRVASHAQFNTLNILTGRFSQGESEGNQALVFQVGANIDQNERIYIEPVTASALGIEGIDITDSEKANAGIGLLDNALKQLSKQRADLGAYQNRFEAAAKGVSIAAENFQASESLIRDANMATEMVGYTKNQILSQAGNAMLAQANTRTQSVLQLLG